MVPVFWVSRIWTVNSWSWILYSVACLGRKPWHHSWFLSKSRGDLKLCLALLFPYWCNACIDLSSGKTGLRGEMTYHRCLGVKREKKKGLCKKISYWFLMTSKFRILNLCSFGKYVILTMASENQMHSSSSAFCFFGEGSQFFCSFVMSHIKYYWDINAAFITKFPWVHCHSNRSRKY